VASVLKLLPGKFHKIPYDGTQYPGSPRLKEFTTGANCQRFAYELLRHFGYEIADFRSSDLWADGCYTVKARRFRPLDLLLFNKDADAHGAHVAVWMGEGKLIHLSKRIGLPEIVTLRQMEERSGYQVLLGAKRVKPKFRRRGTIKMP
jgi:cell wall-associated NlpC family hydrolase